tara:strand:+ start:1275 stop:2186 length:912 start_codon:yes stop_codon:yes gene_type:complete
MQEEKNIDVGEADEQETEIDLEAAPVEEAPAEELVVEETKEVKPVEETPKDELGEYSEGVQKRIAKLTRKMREAERQKEEAITYAQNLKADQEKLQSRYRNVETTYADEFKKRVTGSLEATKAKLQSAINNGDVEGQVAAQTELAQLTMDATRLARIEEMKKAAPVNESPVTQPRQEVPMQQPQTDPKADAWAAKNPWFGTDNAMTYTAFDIHKTLVNEEGFDSNSEEYYAEVDKRIRLEFPHKFGNNESSTSEPVQNVASARRPAKQGRRKTVKLTPSQVAISKRLGVPLEEYAKQLAAKEV